MYSSQHVAVPMRKLLSKSTSPLCWGCSSITYGSSSRAYRVRFESDPIRLQFPLIKHQGKLAAYNNRWYDGKVRSSPRFQQAVTADDERAAVVGWSAVVVVVAAANRVLQKLALVPMKEYPFFLAQLNSIAFVMCFFSILYVRYHAGLTTNEMLAIPKLPLAVVGFLEACSIICGLYAGAMLPGPAIPLLYQTFLIWQLLFSSLLLRRKYPLNQIFGCFLVAAGVVVAVTSGASNGRMLSGVGVMWPALMIASAAFQAAASIVKESVFLDASANLKGKSLDIFVVNSFGSAFQAVFIVLFLPILSNSKGMPLSELPFYFRSAAACFLNLGTKTTGCNGAPLLPLLFIGSNIVFNISVLSLLKVSNAIVASLAGRSSVPIAIYVLSLPLPYLPQNVRLSPFFHLGSLILVAGLMLYNLPRSNNHQI